MLVTMMTMYSCEVVDGATYTMANANDWAIFKLTNWTDAKCVQTNDTLVYKYNKRNDDVEMVDKAGYNNCFISELTKYYRNETTLTEGTNYFICNLGSHCELGMKIAVIAN